MRVIIVEDQALLREGLAGVFREAGHDVAATLGSCEDLEASIAALGPDLVVLDIRLPPTLTDEGARAAAQIKGAHPDIGVLLLPNTSRPRTAPDSPDWPDSATCSRTESSTSPSSSQPLSG